MAWKKALSTCRNMPSRLRKNVRGSNVVICGTRRSFEDPPNPPLIRPHHNFSPRQDVSIPRQRSPFLRLNGDKVIDEVKNRSSYILQLTSFVQPHVSVHSARFSCVKSLAWSHRGLKGERGLQLENTDAVEAHEVVDNGSNR
jgi:hypothetical protein